jgi:uncharacterized protein
MSAFTRVTLPGGISAQEAITVYGVTWLAGLTLIGMVVGLAGGWFLAVRSGRYNLRVETLEAELAAARRQLDEYRQQVVTEFSETARKFQTLNDAYTDLHRHLARSSSELCGDVSGPLLAAPQGHQDLLTAETRPDADTNGEGDAPSEPAHQAPSKTALDPPATAAGRDRPTGAESGREAGAQRSL